MEMFLAPLPMVYISQFISFMGYVQMLVASTTEINFDFLLFLVIKEGYSYHKLCKICSEIKS